MILPLLHHCLQPQRSCYWWLTIGKVPMPSTRTASMLEQHDIKPVFVHADVHELEYNSAGTLYSAMMEVFTLATGSSWTDVHRKQEYCTDIPLDFPLSPTIGITGHQDNGSNISQRVNPMPPVIPEMGLGIVLWTTATTMFWYTRKPNGGLVRSTNGGSSRQALQPVLSGSTNWLTPWKQDPSSASTFACWS